MHASILMLICSLFYITLIAVLYFSKRRVKLLENKVYSGLILLSIIGIIIDIMGIYSHLNLPETSFIRWLIVKSYFVYLLDFVYLLTLYIIFSTIKSRPKVANNKPYLKKVRYIFFFIYTIFFIINLILPFEYYNEGKIVYVVGPNATFLYTIFGISVILWIFYILANLKYLQRRKYIPLLALVIIGVPIAYIQMTNPQLLLVTSLTSFIVCLMYFTIENPDLNTLKELRDARDFVEKSNNEKTMFLFDMSQKIKVPVTRILNQSNNIINDDNMDSIEEEANDIKYYSKKLLQMIDNVLDISALERYDFKLVNSTYNVGLLLKEIEIMTRKSIIEKEIEFRSNISSSLPSQLYGDPIRLKQIINVIMNNAIKYTDKGFIELTVNSVIKHDVCRLIITIEDSGKGMTSEEIEEIFDKEKLIDNDDLQKIDTNKENLAIANSLARIIGGTIMVSSELGKGSNFTIVLDQKISKEYKTETMKKLETYEEQMEDKEKIMLVGYNEEEIKKLNKVISKYNIKVEYGSLGIDCLNQVRNGNKYKLILMREAMDKLDGITVFYKLKEIETFEIPVIIVGKETDKKKINKYKEDGLKEYIESPLTKEKLIEVIKNIEY